MKKLLLYLLLCVPFLCNGQRIDTVVVTPLYSSYYSYSVGNPLYVSYKVPHYSKRGKFKCEYTFVDEKGPINSSYYYGTGFDRGHLAPAEDFSSTCELKYQTYRYWNCIPQYPNLNRGIWKVLEVQIRKLSVTSNLLVLDGGFDYYKYKESKLYVPSRCWKVCISLDTNSVIYCKIYSNLLFGNSYIDVTVNDLVLRLGYTPIELIPFLTK